MEISKSTSRRANITTKKYQKQIDWRRNKVRELLIRGYSKYQIPNTLHLSQPTISRDMHYISQLKIKKKEYRYEFFYNHQNTLDGMAELIKKLWTILDNPKTKKRKE